MESTSTDVKPTTGEFNAIALEASIVTDVFNDVVLENVGRCWLRNTTSSLFWLAVRPVTAGVPFIKVCVAITVSSTLVLPAALAAFSRLASAGEE